MGEGLNVIFSVLGEFVRLATSWFPRPYLVNTTQRAVRFRRGAEPVLVAPGFRWYTPLFSTIQVFSILQEATEFSPTILPTKDGKTIAIGFVVAWHVEPQNVVKFATTAADATSIIGEIGESLLPPLVIGFTMPEIMERVRGARGLKTVDNSISAEAQSLLAKYGISVDWARINFLAPSRVYRLIGPSL